MSLLAAGPSAASDLRFWRAFDIVAVAVLGNAMVASIEDDLPGGFNNPRGTSTPLYVYFADRGLRGIGAVLHLLCAIAFALCLAGIANAVACIIRTSSQAASGVVVEALG